MTRRLIEDWLPIAALGEESVRERRSMTALPPTYYLHVWWARRPLVASRAAVLGSLLPSTADRERFLHMVGIHGDPVASRRRIDAAKRKGQRFEGEAYSYSRAFGYVPTAQDRAWAADEQRKLGLTDISVLDPTAGGGSIPFESARLGYRTFGNDLNPVASIVERATIEFPFAHGMEVHRKFRHLADEYVKRREERLTHLYPKEPISDSIPTNYLWARTVRCPHCEGKVPLSPNWRLLADGTGLRFQTHLGSGPGDESRRLTFTLVHNAKDQSQGTVSGGDATCPFEDCGRLISGEEVKEQAQAGKMGEQMYAIVFRNRVVTGKTKAGKPKVKWVRDFRAPRAEDDVEQFVKSQLDEMLPEWEALDIVPTEQIGELSNYDRGHRLYGMYKWTDMFSPRQLYGHCVGVEIFRALLSEETTAGRLDESLKAAFVYLSFAIDKLVNYNARSTRWDLTTGRVRSVFDSHNFAMVWSYAEVSPLVNGVGNDWTIEQTAGCIEELVKLTRPESVASHTGQAGLEFDIPPVNQQPKITLTCGSGDSLNHIRDATVDAVVLDPPYYDNVMYAELSDFFYVWLKRTSGYVFPELFGRVLTDKENEAIANPAKFKDQKGAKVLAGRDYQHRMAAIFMEARRVLKPDGVMTLMFTHKATGAWDALTKGLIEAGFTITASWPINTEAEGSLHIKDKSAANSTVFLVCRPRVQVGDDVRYWEDVEPTVRNAVRMRIAQFQQGGIRGVDLYLSCFGPALEAFSQNWPLVRGTPRQDIEQTRRKKRQAEIFEEEYDPYAVTPEDALEVARREVKDWRLNQLAHVQRNVELDNLTSWFVLAWDAFEAPIFPYDEANRLAKVCGVDLDREVVGRLAEKKGSDLVMWDSVTRAAKGSLGLPDGRDSMMDALHHLARTTRSASLELLAPTEN
jgi:putative DNA methylase